MSKKVFVTGMLALALVFGSLVSGCATYATRGGVVTPSGCFTPTMQADGGRKTVGSYIILFGLFTLGYKDFIDQTAGKDVDIVDSNFLWIFRSIRAVER
ncbi:MAG: hypothetical protein LBR16_08485 [Treponema sp.]|jgi:hypothetical protein|nr:hypothetical protein [Treponema sp.]